MALVSHQQASATAQTIKHTNYKKEIFFINSEGFIVKKLLIDIKPSGYPFIESSIIYVQMSLYFF